MKIHFMPKTTIGKWSTGLFFAFLLFLLISSIIGLAVIFLVNPGMRRLQKQAAAARRKRL